MTPDPLERPMWNSLRGPQSHLADGGPQALRLDPQYGPFAAALDCGAESQAALAAFLRDDRDWMLVVESKQWPCPPGLQVVEVVPLVQMAFSADRPAAPSLAGPVVERLGESDVPAMRALVAATEPGPWAEMTHRFGNFYGIREDLGGGPELTAMAGERFRPAPGLAELSGVCTATAARGRGLAARVIERVIAAMAGRGETAFLRCRVDNAVAIQVYRALGFEPTREMVVTALARG